MKDNNFNFNQVFLNTLDSEAKLRTEQLLSFSHLESINAYISGKSLSILLAKASFAFLLISMLSYWFQMSFKPENLRDSRALTVVLRDRRLKRLALQSKKGSSVATPMDCSHEMDVSLQEAESYTYNKESLRLLPRAELRVSKKPIVASLTLANCFASEGKKKQPFLALTPSGLAKLTKETFRYPKELAFDSKGVSSWQDDKELVSSCSASEGKPVLNRKNFLEKLPLVTMWSANITLAILLSIRWIESGHFPLSNLYESLLFLSWSLTVIHLFLENLFYKREQILCSATNSFPSDTKEGFQRNPRLLRTKEAELRTAPTLTLGAITSPVALFTNAFATFSLPQEMQKVTVLVPALKSNWLIMHVSVMIISYAALLSGSLLAMAFLVIKFIGDKKIPFIVSTFLNSLPFLANAFPKKGTRKPSLLTQLLDRESNDLLVRSSSEAAASGYIAQRGRVKEQIEDELAVGALIALTPSGYTKETLRYPEGVGKQDDKRSKPLLLKGSAANSYELLCTKEASDSQFLDLPQILDNLSYRSIGLGFALLTIGILSGAVWANEAWGSYWSWDPKETWAFITWLVFALYLHTRLSKGWVGKESAFVASFGFVVIWFCYLGVNLFGKGLHSYGWFQQ